VKEEGRQAKMFFEVKNGNEIMDLLARIAGHLL
jgi:hypothetical protein